MANRKLVKTSKSETRSTVKVNGQLRVVFVDQNVYHFIDNQGIKRSSTLHEIRPGQ